MTTRAPEKRPGTAPSRDTTARRRRLAALVTANVAGAVAVAAGILLVVYEAFLIAFADWEDEDPTGHYVLAGLGVLLVVAPLVAGWLVTRRARWLVVAGLAVGAAWWLLALVT